MCIKFHQNASIYTRSDEQTYCMYMVKLIRFVNTYVHTYLYCIWKYIALRLAVCVCVCVSIRAYQRSSALNNFLYTCRYVCTHVWILNFTLSIKYKNSNFHVPTAWHASLTANKRHLPASSKGQPFTTDKPHTHTVVRRGC